MRIHLDNAFAKSIGLPGIIIHGRCTMEFTSVALIEHACPDDPNRLERLAVRFFRTVQPGQTITTRIWAGDDGTYPYETESDDDAGSRASRPSVCDLDPPGGKPTVQPSFRR